MILVNAGRVCGFFKLDKVIADKVDSGVRLFKCEIGHSNAVVMGSGTYRQAHRLSVRVCFRIRGEWIAR